MWQDPAFDASGGTSVGSANSQDIFLGYGTEFNNPDRFILDISDVIHMLGADQTKLISWLQYGGTKPTDQISFHHMESELMTVRDFKGKVTRTADGSDYVWLLELDSPQDWQAIETAALGDGDWTDADKPQIYMTVKVVDQARDFSVVIRKHALNGQSMRNLPAHDGNATNSPGSKKDVIVLASGTTGAPVIGGSDNMVGTGLQEVGTVPAGVGGGAFTPGDFATASTDVVVNVVTPNAHLGGYAQGSGLPNESRHKSRSVTNFVQIFKTPVSITNTLKAVAMRGGDELAMKRYRKLIQHKTDIEQAIMFQAGGVLNVDYGILDSGDENPLTRFMGLGVGLAATGNTGSPGAIITKNCDLHSDNSFTLSQSASNASAIHTLCESLFDDLVDDASETKVMMCSNKWLTAIANLAATHSSGFTFGDHTEKNTLGIPGIRTLTSPVGSLRLMPFKHLRGRFEDYAVVLDMKNIKYRPLRPTKMLSNVESDAVDGQLDYFITEAGVQVLHESTHAVCKLIA